MPDGMNGLTGRGYKPYPAYKDSGVTWIGQVPAHWSVRAFRRSITRIEQGWSPVAEDRLAGSDEWAVIKLSAVSKGMFDSSEHKALPAEIAPDTRYEICEGDFLVTRANTPELVGDVCVVRGVRAKLMLSDLVYRLRLKTDDVQSTFLAYWLVSRVGRYQIEVDARGSSQSMVKVSQGHIRDWMLLLPSVEEQRAIVAFLDHETGVIDALVAKKERLIELLQEKRTALITRAVTKGLDPNVPMKDSGVEWLGEIPAHWEVSPLKRLWARCDYGVSDSLAGSGEIRVLTMGHIQDGEISVPEEGSLAEVLENLLLERNDLLFNRTNSRELVGKVGIFRGSIRDRVSFASYLVRLRAKANVSPEYLNYLLNSEGLLSIARSLALLSVNQANLNPTRYGEIPVPKPPVEEQDLISRQTSKVAKELDGLTKRIRGAIDRLRELRTALISAAVTGKIDVREAVS